MSPFGLPLPQHARLEAVKAGNFVPFGQDQEDGSGEGHTVLARVMHGLF